MPNLNSVIYYVNGMHCASCELIIKRKLSKISGIKSVNPSNTSGKIEIIYENEKPSLDLLNKLFKDDHYTFSENKSQKHTSSYSINDYLSGLSAALVFIFIFWLADRAGISSYANVQSGSGFLSFGILGLLAGVSSCGALVGGIVLSMTKKWQTYNNSSPLGDFIIGRLISYFIVGAILGYAGSFFKMTPAVSAVFVIIVSVLMAIMGLQMLGVSFLKAFQIKLPKSLTEFSSNESNFGGRYMPFMMGTLTVILPCGFTLTTEGLAAVSGSTMQGGLYMLAFALGTALPIYLIGKSGDVLINHSGLSKTASITAGLLILFFAFFNITRQYNIIGPISQRPLNVQAGKPVQNTGNKNDNSANLQVNGTQVIKMDANSRGYTPSTFKVKAGTPVRWEITDTGTSGCTNALIAPSLFSDSVNLVRGQTVVKEFTPTTPGVYRFSCWMGMITGSIEVVSN